MEKPVLREYYVIDFYALYLVIRMPASWHVFADPVTYSSYASKVTSDRTRSFRIIRFREKRDLTYAAIAPHSHHMYNSDGILDRSWRNYTELKLPTVRHKEPNTP